MSLVSFRCVFDTVEVAFTLGIHVNIDIGSSFDIVVDGHSFQRESLDLVVIDLFEVPCHSMLTTVFILRLSRQVVNHLTCQPDVGHGVENGSVGYVIPNPHDLAEEARLHSVDVVAFS